MLICVTQENIDDGEADFETCPVALAMRDAGLSKPWVTPVSVSWYSRGVDRRSAIPDEVAAWINEYDHGRPVQPFSFHIDEEGQ